VDYNKKLVGIDSVQFRYDTTVVWSQIRQLSFGNSLSSFGAHSLYLQDIINRCPFARLSFAHKKFWRFIPGINS